MLSLDHHEAYCKILVLGLEIEVVYIKSTVLTETVSLFFLCVSLKLAGYLCMYLI